MCGSRKYPYPPHGGSRNFLGVGGSKRDKFLKGRGVHKEFFFPEGLKCDRMNTYVFFQLIRGSQEKPKVLSVEIDVGFLVIYFLLLSRRQMTRTAPRHTSEHVRRRVKQNGWLEKYRSQSNIGCIERTRGNEFERKWVICALSLALHFHLLGFLFSWFVFIWDE